MKSRKKWVVVSLMSLVLVSGCVGLLEFRYFPVVRSDMEGAFRLLAVQPPMTLPECREALERYIRPIRTQCAACRIERASCEPVLLGDEVRLWSADPIDKYSISAGPMRLMIFGPEPDVKPVCATMAQDLSAKGVSAVCVEPGVAR